MFDVYNFAQLQGTAPEYIRKNPQRLFSTEESLSIIARQLTNQIRTSETVLSKKRMENMKELAKPIPVLKQYNKSGKIKYKMVIYNSIGFPKIINANSITDVKMFLAKSLGFGNNYKDNIRLPENEIAIGIDYYTHVNNKGEPVDFVLNRFFL